MNIEPESPIKLCLKGWMLSCILILLVAGIHIIINDFVQYLESGKSELIDWITKGNIHPIFNVPLNLIVLLLLALFFGAGTLLIIFLVGSPIYAIIFTLAYYFSIQLVKFKPLSFSKYFLLSYLFFGSPIAICAVIYFISDFKFVEAIFLHMTPFYALVIVPFNIGYMWLNVVEKKP